MTFREVGDQNDLLGKLHVGAILSRTCDGKENELLMSFPFNHTTVTELSTKKVILRDLK